MTTKQILATSFSLALQCGGGNLEYLEEAYPSDGLRTMVFIFANYLKADIFKIDRIALAIIWLP